MTSSGSSGAREPRGLRNDQISGLLLLLLAVFIGWQNRAYPVGTLAEPGPGYLPLALAIFLGLTGLLIVANSAGSPPFSETRWPEFRRAVVVLAACGMAAVALEPLGYRLSMIALLVFFLGAVEHRKPLAVAAVAIGFSLVSYFVFATWLRVPLPRGPWGF